MKKEKSGVGPLLTDEQLGSLGSWAEYSDQELVVDEFLEEATGVVGNRCRQGLSLQHRP